MTTPAATDEQTLSKTPPQEGEQDQPQPQAETPPQAEEPQAQSKAAEAPQQEQTPQEPDTDDEAREEHAEALEILEPKADPKRWVIGKPPEAGGKEDEFSIYVQKPLGYMSRMRFFSLVSSTVANAIKAGGSIDLGFGSQDLLAGSGSIRQRAAALSETSFSDTSSFMALAMQLIAYSPDFLLECYCLWLDVPPAERIWAKMVMEQPRDPNRNKWGLTDDEGLEMIEIFIDQNYEDIRGFFGEKLPRLVNRVRQRETERQDRASTSVPSKQ